MIINFSNLVGKNPHYWDILRNSFRMLIDGNETFKEIELYVNTPTFTKTYTYCDIYYCIYYNVPLHPTDFKLLNKYIKEAIKHTLFQIKLDKFLQV